VHDAPQPAQILFERRTIHAELRAQGRDPLRADLRVLEHEGLEVVARTRRELDHGPADERDSDQQRPEQNEAADDVPDHRARAAARAAT
jgi:hypothetical protein